MSKHKNRGPRLPDFTPPAPMVVMAGDGEQRMITDAELGTQMDVVTAAIQASPYRVLDIESTPSVTPVDAFRAEEMDFRPGATSVIQQLHTYLNDFRKANPNAALLQMIQTGTASYTFVWEL